MSVAAAVLAAAGSLVGLLNIGSVYGREAAAFVEQAIAQDLVNLAVITPATVILALLALRGSRAAHLAWLGVVAFTVYNYVIYTLSIHVGPLYLAWIAVLGLSLFALIGGLTPARIRDRIPVTEVWRAATGWYLVIIAVLFAGLWLADIVPAVLTGEVPAGARDLELPSNPVHVLDLAFYLPAALAAGVLLLRDNAWGHATAPGLLIFLALTGLPILLTPFVAAARGGHRVWPVLVPITVITLASLTLALRMLGAARQRTPGR
ncbi:hypothetical protein AB0M43_17665 [Longispora sp. NPDC051575]|uniref:hypothetical protein n=1 Tax=Longispora sp. NPDC051575 TaxID=3154943 RepID=UPI003425B9DB